MKETIREKIELLDFLKQNFPNSSTNKLRKMLSQGRIEVNQITIHKAKHQLLPNDIVELLDKPRKEIKPQTEIKFKNYSIDLIYEDDQILVVEKPAKLLSVATDKLETDTLHSKCVDYLKQKDPKSWAYIVHRLDKETSGVMILAKTKSAKEYLQEQFSQREVYRIYHTLVEGILDRGSGTILQYLTEDKHLNIKSTSKTNRFGKQAITHFETLTKHESTTLVRVMIETGRRHQIRMAMQSIGHPIVGDSLHGATTNPFSRICLHATSLEFLHPETDDPVRFEAKHPFDKL
jgi:23S rRNA pseudouridine1911/1915/1917 synthase